MRIILSSDAELWSWNKNFKQDVWEGVLKLVEVAEKEKIPLTLFVSLSDKGYGNFDYLEKITSLVKRIKSKYISFGIHSHCKNLPLNFPTPSDYLRDYQKDQIIQILQWYKEELEKITKNKVLIHRAGSYAIPNLDVLNECFKETKIIIDSSDISREYSKLLRLKNFVEIPPATNREYSKKLRVWSPEQMSLKEMLDFYFKAKNKTDVLVVNFHSFSVYGNLGWKKKVWYKVPNWLRGLLRPAINPLKNKISMQETKEDSQKEVSENFKNLKKLIEFLKAEKCEFVNFNRLGIK
jgi:hypothetical protein